MISVIGATILALAQASGQSIQNWINSPEGQRHIHKVIKMIGQEALLRLFKKLGI